MAGMWAYPAVRRETPPDRDFQDFTERVYQQKKDAILDELKQLEKGTHAAYIEQVAQLKREHEQLLKMNKRHKELELEDIEEELKTTIKRAEDEYQENLQKFESSLRQELDGYKKELIDEHRTAADAKTSIMRDVQSSRTDRSSAERKRRRVFDDNGGRGSRKRRPPRKYGVGGVREASTALRLPPEAQKAGQACERLATWEIEQDIRQMHKHPSTSRGRSSRPPAKLKDGITPTLQSRKSGGL